MTVIKGARGRKGSREWVGKGSQKYERKNMMVFRKETKRSSSWIEDCDWRKKKCVNTSMFPLIEIKSQCNMEAKRIIVTRREMTLEGRRREAEACTMV